MLQCMVKPANKATLFIEWFLLTNKADRLVSNYWQLGGTTKSEPILFLATIGQNNRANGLL